MKDICKNPLVNIISNAKRRVVFSLRMGTRPRYLLSTFLFNVVLEVLAASIRQEQEIKAIHIGKEERKLSLFEDDMIVCAENPKECMKNKTKQLS